MAVEPESYGLNETQALKRKTCVVGVKRARNGNWKVIVDVEIEVRLPDGRLVTAWQEVNLRGRGEPKPHPDPKWLYKGNQGRARSRLANPAVSRYRKRCSECSALVRVENGLIASHSTGNWSVFECGGSGKPPRKRG